MQEYLTIDDIPDIYRKYLKEILAFVYNFVHNHDDAEELTHDVFIKLYDESGKKQINKTNIRAYLYKMARNHCIDQARKNKIKSVEMKNGVFEIANNRTSEEKLVDSLLIKSIYSYIDTNLAESEKTVFKLKHFYGLNHREIADIVDTSISSISRILDKVARELEKKFPDIL